MVEGDNVFKEAIQFLKSLPPLKPLQWDENLCRSAQEHVDDIGPKGLLLYQSSDGTEPEDRISKYGNYVESLGENIDFGPNDAMGVIISLTLDAGSNATSPLWTDFSPRMHFKSVDFPAPLSPTMHR